MKLRDRNNRISYIIWLSVWTDPAPPSIRGDTKEMIIFAHRAQWQNGRRFHAGSTESDMLKRVVRE
jgi:hypothetical protein